MVSGIRYQVSAVMYHVSLLRAKRIKNESKMKMGGPKGGEDAHPHPCPQKLPSSQRYAGGVGLLAAHVPKENPSRML